jgi:hypothetical protein
LQLQHVVFTGRLSEVIRAQDRYSTLIAQVGLQLNPAESQLQDSAQLQLNPAESPFCSRMAVNDSICFIVHFQGDALSYPSW